MKNIKDYLHLYLGCEVETNITGQMIQQYGALKITNMTVTDLNFIIDALERQERYNGPTGYYCKIKLTPLSKMTKKQNRELAEIIGMETDKEVHIWTPEQFLWLLENEFDLFNLIPDGLAIDKTTLK